MKPGKVQLALLLLGLALLWVASQAPGSRLASLGITILGAGVAAGGFYLLQAANESRSEPGALSGSQQLLLWLRGLAQSGLGLAISLGALAAVVLGGDRFLRLLTQQPAPALLAVGALLLAQAVNVALAQGEPMGTRWHWLASLPLRLTSLPLLLLGLLSLGVGFYALLAPAQFRAWLGMSLGPFFQAP